MEPSTRRDDEPPPQRVVSACGGLIVAGKATEEAMQKPQAKRMVWSNENCISSRVTLPTFLRSMGRYKPSWFCVVYTTDGVNKSELSHLFGYHDYNVAGVITVRD
jgi:hypothetical protein